MPVPQLRLPFSFTKDVAHHSAIRVLESSTQAGPGGDVLGVEGDVVRLCQRVQVNVVEAEQILSTKIANRCHLSTAIVLSNGERR